MNITDLIVDVDKPYKSPYSECEMDSNYILYNGNDAFYDMLGDNSFFPFTYGIHPDDVAEFEAACKALETESDKTVLLTRYRGYSDDDYQIFELTITLNISPSGEKRGYEVKLLNLFTVKKIYQRNINNVRKYRNYMSMMNLYYFEYDIKKNFFQVYVYLFEKSYLIIHEDFDEWYEKAKYQLDAEADKLALNKFYKALKGGMANFTIHITAPFFSKDNNTEELICTGKTVTLQTGDNVFGIMKKKNDYAESNLAYYFTEAGKDPATGLLNKRASLEYSKDLLADKLSGRRYMIIIDIDDFKDFNDIYGHIFGDSVILTVSRVLSNVVNIRGIVGRIGGDEFYVLTDNVETEKDLRVLLKTISKNLRYAYENIKEEVQVSISVGISCYPDNGTDYETLFEKADKALYIAKEKGKNRHIIYSESKHGLLPGRDIDVSDKNKTVLKYEQYANMISDMVLMINSLGLDAIDRVMTLAKHYFGIHEMQIANANGEFLYSTSVDKKELTEAEREVLSFSEYRALYNDYSVYAENNIQNTMKYSQQLYDVMSESEINSFLHIAYPSISDPKVFMFFDICNARRKWSEEDKSLLMIFGRVVLERICRDKGL
ncbi:MAG: GGDEF domain-containing protein [Lachnospiraceae bacterium]|nr:GGDEF domain-containing protein [Lachnospiraceae bacterium]